MVMTNSSSNTKEEEEEDAMRINTAKAVAKAAVANANAVQVKTTITTSTSTPTSTSTSTSTSTHPKKIQLKLKLQLQSGIPPWHTILALFIILFLFIIPNLPTKKSLDEYSTIEVITKCKFPMYLSLKGLAYIRILIGCIALSLTIYLYFSNGWEFYPNYIKKYTKLQHIKLHLYRFGTLCPFTSVSWLILGVGFLLRGIICLASAYASYDVVYNEDDNDDNSNSNANANANNNNFIIIIITNYILKENTWLLRITFILWELTGPYAVLTSTVIKYVIWPAALRAGPADSPHNLAGWRNQLQHNCNSIFSLLEVTLLGGIPVSLHHITLPIFVGCIYMILTWILGILYYFNTKNINNTKGKNTKGNNTNTNTNKVVVGPQYIYFFMDTSMGIMTTYCMIGLLLAMMIIYTLFSLVIKILNTDTDTGGEGVGVGVGDNDNVEGVGVGKDSLLANITFFITGILLVCRFRN